MRACLIKATPPPCGVALMNDITSFCLLNSLLRRTTAGQRHQYSNEQQSKALEHTLRPSFGIQVGFLVILQASKEYLAEVDLTISLRISELPSRQTNKKKDLR
jgi:hypothetical protein